MDSAGWNDLIQKHSSFFETLAVTSALPREEWLSFREGGIGGSDAGVIMGLDNYKSRLELYHEKIGSPFIESDDGENEYAYWGHTLEPILMREFEKRTGIPVIFSDVLIRSREHPFMLATPDCFVCEDNELGVLDIKTTGSWRGKDWEEGVPPVHIAQVPLHGSSQSLFFLSSRVDRRTEIQMAPCGKERGFRRGNAL
jgi:putative phage-type endonuclease